MAARSTKSRSYLVRGTDELRCAATGRSACATERRQRADRRPVSPTRGPGSTPPSSSAPPSATPSQTVAAAAGCPLSARVADFGAMHAVCRARRARQNPNDRTVCGLGDGHAQLPEDDRTKDRFEMPCSARAAHCWVGRSGSVVPAVGTGLATGVQGCIWVGSGGHTCRAATWHHHRCGVVLDRGLLLGWRAQLQGRKKKKRK